jgi:hypothetical protein
VRSRRPSEGRGRPHRGDPARRGRVEGDRDRVPGHPRRPAGPVAALLPVPPDAAAARPGRGEQDLGHPVGVLPGARQHRQPLHGAPTAPFRRRLRRPRSTARRATRSPPARRRTGRGGRGGRARGRRPRPRAPRSPGCTGVPPGGEPSEPPPLSPGP